MWYEFNVNEKKTITLLKIGSQRLNLALFRRYVTFFLVVASSF